MKKLLAGLLLTSAFSAMSVEITVGTGTCAGTYVAICTQMDSEVKEAMEADLPDVSIGDYGSGLANANGFAQKGLGSDYSDKFSYGMVRGGFGAAVEGDMSEPEKATGFGIGAAATVGVNLDLLPIDKIGPVDLSKMDLFVSFMSYNVDQDSDDFAAEGDLSAFGVMARYQIMEGVDIFPGYMLEWGGIFLHTGFQRSSFEADLTSKAFDGETVEVSGQQASFSNSSATFTLDTTTTTIPVEVSTYLRTVWALTFFGGAGFDFVSGSTDVDLTAKATLTGGSGGNTYNNTINASESDSGDADATNFRAFGGIQLNLPFFRVYAQANKGLGNDLLGANFGAKILW